jgi:hypothetical protein
MKNKTILFGLILGALFIISSCSKTNEACSITPVIDNNSYPLCLECYSPPIKYYFDPMTKECKSYPLGGGTVPFDTEKECDCACKN